jgi:hypothetical protein
MAGRFVATALLLAALAVARGARLPDEWSKIGRADDADDHEVKPGTLPGAPAMTSRHFSGEASAHVTSIASAPHSRQGSVIG